MYFFLAPYISALGVFVCVCLFVFCLSSSVSPPALSPAGGEAIWTVNELLHKNNLL